MLIWQAEAIYPMMNRENLLCKRCSPLGWEEDAPKKLYIPRAVSGRLLASSFSQEIEAIV